MCKPKIHLLTRILYTIERLPNETIHGKIIFHDRERVQSEILPMYFKHASFASCDASYLTFPLSE